MLESKCTVLFANAQHGTSHLFTLLIFNVYYEEEGLGYMITISTQSIIQIYKGRIIFGTCILLVPKPLQESSKVLHLFD